MARGDGYNRPSEHRRYIRLMEDVLDCPKVSQLDGDGFRAYVQILLMLNRTKSRDGKIVLNKHALMAATAKGRHDAARRVARHLADVGLMSVRHRGDVSWITVPKWAELQGFASPPIPVPVPVESTPTVQPDLEDSLTDKQVANLKAIQPLQLQGVEISDGDIRCWFAMVAPRMRAKGVNNCARPAPNWWPNVRPSEIKDAVRWVRAQSPIRLVESEPRQEDSFDEFADMFASTDNHKTRGVNHGNHRG